MGLKGLRGLRESVDAFVELNDFVHVVIGEAERATHVEDESGVEFAVEESSGDVSGHEF